MPWPNRRQALDPVDAAWNDLGAGGQRAAPQVELEPVASAVVELEPAPAEKLEPCPACGTVPKAGQTYCDDCGWMFSNGPIRGDASAIPNPAPPPAEAAPAAMPVATAAAAVLNSPAAAASLPAPFREPGMRLRDRYEFGTLLGERAGISRYSGFDHDAEPPRPVVIVQAALPEIPEAVLPLEDEPLADGEEIFPSFEEPLARRPRRDRCRALAEPGLGTWAAQQSQSLGSAESG